MKGKVWNEDSELTIEKAKKLTHYFKIKKMLKKLEKIQQEKYGGSRSPSLSEERYSRITKTLVNLEEVAKVDKYRKKKLLEKLENFSPM